MQNKQYKVTNMGQLPGDFPLQEKIKMMENPRSPVERSSRKDHLKKANRRFRHNKDYLKNIDEDII